MTNQQQAAEHSSPPPIDYEAFQQRPEFQAYKRRFRRFVFPIAAAFMIWFLGFVLLGAFAHDFMAQPLNGLNVGIWLGLAQFLTTFVITMCYVSFANKRLDPATAQLREELEALEQAGAGDGGPTDAALGSEGTR